MAANLLVVFALPLILVSFVNAGLLVSGRIDNSDGDPELCGEFHLNVTAPVFGLIKIAWDLPSAMCLPEYEKHRLVISSQKRISSQNINLICNNMECAGADRRTIDVHIPCPGRRCEISSERIMFILYPCMKYSISISRFYDLKEFRANQDVVTYEQIPFQPRVVGMQVVAPPNGDDGDVHGGRNVTVGWSLIPWPYSNCVAMYRVSWAVLNQSSSGDMLNKASYRDIPADQQPWTNIQLERNCYAGICSKYIISVQAITHKGFLGEAKIIEGLFSLAIIPEPQKEF